MKNIDSATVLKLSVRDELQCKVLLWFGELQNILVEQLYMCVEFLWKSERYELIADVNKPIIAVFEKQRDFKVSFQDLDDKNPAINWLITYYFQKQELPIFYVSIIFMKPFDLWFQKLSDLYYDIHRSYLKVAEVVNSEKRLFGRYYRVAFYGQVSSLEVAWPINSTEQLNVVFDSLWGI